MSTNAPMPMDAASTAASGFSAVCIGASAGGVEALLRLLAPLPSGYALPVIVTIHMPDDRESVLADVFRHRSRLDVREARDKENIAPGAIYFAPAGYHLLLERDASFALNCDPPVNHARPAIDLLFESAADVWGPELVAVLLTGANDDGARGLEKIAQAGGRTVVQDPKTARASTMPQSAIDRYSHHTVLPLDGIARLLLQLDPRHD